MKTALLSVALTLSATVALAQTTSSWAAPLEPEAPSEPVAMANPGAPNKGDPITQALPVDGGLGLLALAGGAYAVRRLRSKE